MNQTFSREALNEIQLTYTRRKKQLISQLYRRLTMLRMPLWETGTRNSRLLHRNHRKIERFIFRHGGAVQYSLKVKVLCTSLGLQDHVHLCIALRS